MRFIKHCKYYCSFIVLVMMVPISFAYTAQMNATLVRINTILNQVYPLINLAQKQQPASVRVKFQFNALREDIARIQAGITQAVNRVSIQPRVVKPLSGDYLPIPGSVLNRQKPIADEDEHS
jgi:RAQPRD family integrative conjugative element protein